MNIPKFAKAIEALSDIKNVLESEELKAAIEGIDLPDDPSVEEIVKAINTFTPISGPVGEAIKAFTNDATDAKIDKFVKCLQKLSIAYDQEKQLALARNQQWPSGI